MNVSTLRQTGARRPARPAITTLLLALAVLLLGAFSDAPSADVAKERAELDAMAEATLAELYRRQPQAKDLIAGSAGYAVFSNFGMKLVVSGSGKGKGIAVDNATGMKSYMKMLEVQAGVGFGIKKFRLVWVFEDKKSFDSFISQGRQFGGQAALSAKGKGKGRGVAGAIPVDKGVWLFQLNDKGLAAEVTVKASKYFKDKDLN